jgi:hypothetical protein
MNSDAKYCKSMNYGGLCRFEYPLSNARCFVSLLYLKTARELGRVRIAPPDYLLSFLSALAYLEDASKLAQHTDARTP